MYCSSCGKEIDESSVFCAWCGKKVAGAVPVVLEKTPVPPPVPVMQPGYNVSTPEQYEAPLSEKKEWVALVLCIFLGFFGAHRFYVGKKRSGLLYLFTCGIVGVGWIIDLILIVFGYFKDKNGLDLE